MITVCLEDDTDVSVIFAGVVIFLCTLVYADAVEERTGLLFSVAVWDKKGMMKQRKSEKKD